MRRAPALAALVCAAVAGAGAAVGVPAALGAHATRKAPTRKAPTHLLVYAQEWSLWPSRSSLPAGSVSVELWNRGQDAHDLRLRRLRGGHMVGPIDGAVKVTLSGGLSQSSWKLRPGRYMLYCSMPGHYMKGMHTVLTVR
jgi:hypothetical protein